MVEREHKLHSVAADASRHLRVMRERDMIEFPALRLYTCPRDREAEKLAAHGGGCGDVLTVAVRKISPLARGVSP